MKLLSPIHSNPTRATLEQWTVGIAIAALAAAVRFFHIGARPLWLDEGYSWWDAQQTLSRLWSLVPQCDPHPPLYFLALKLWMNEFGDSSEALRALSALFGVATTALVILAGREIDTRIGWLAGLLFALTPFQIDYGREARPYALLCFGAALMVFGALRVVSLARRNANMNSSAATDPQSTTKLKSVRWGWFSLVAGGVVVLWTNNTAIFLVIAILVAFGLLLVIEPDTRSLAKPLILAATLIIALWLPYVPVVVQQAHGVIDDFWIPPPDLWRVVEELSGLIGLNMHDAVKWAALVLLFGVFVLWRTGAHRAAVLIASLIVVPIALNYAFSVTVRPIFLSRSMIGITPAVVLAMASATLFVKRSFWRYGVIVSMLTVHMYALYVWREADQGNEPWDRIAHELAPSSKAAASDELVLLTANELALPLEHAFEDLHINVSVQGAPANFPSPGMHARYPSGKCAPSLLNQDLGAIARTIARYHVIYFITRTNNVYDPGNRMLKLLRSIGYTEIKEKNFAPGSLELHEFIPQAPALPMRGR